MKVDTGPGFRSGVFCSVSILGAGLAFTREKRWWVKTHPTDMDKQTQHDQPRFKTIATNRKARHEYAVLETVEAGIELVGPEVKSLRAGRANLSDAFGRFDGTQLYVYQLHISPYAEANRWNTDATRPRRLLMHKHELLRWMGKVEQKGLTIIPLSMYFKDSRVKVEIGLCQGKKLYDKRDSIKQREQKREMERVIKKYR